MSLKGLISLFAEKFLQNKSSWVGGQGYPSGNQTTLSLQKDTWGKYVAPTDGYFFVKENNAEDIANVSIYTPDMYVSCVGKDWIRLFIPVRKGQEVSYYFNVREGASSSSTTFAFAKSVGAS